MLISSLSTATLSNTDTTSLIPEIEGFKTELTFVSYPELLNTFPTLNKHNFFKDTINSIIKQEMFNLFEKSYLTFTDNLTGEVLLEFTLTNLHPPKIAPEYESIVSKDTGYMYFTKDLFKLAESLENYV